LFVVHEYRDTVGVPHGTGGHKPQTGTFIRIHVFMKPTITLVLGGNYAQKNRSCNQYVIMCNMRVSFQNEFFFLENLILSVPYLYKYTWN
jgi:hypothetical protein